MNSRCFTLFLFTLLVVSTLETSSAFGGVDIPRKKCFQHCEVKMPDHLEEIGGESVWIWNTFPAYCTTERVRISMAYRDTKCLTLSSDFVNYCDLTHLAYTLPKRHNDLTYRCNVYNATTSQFFYSGNVWPDYASC